MPEPSAPPIVVPAPLTSAPATPIATKALRSDSAQLSAGRGAEPVGRSGAGNPVVTTPALTVPPRADPAPAGTASGTVAPAAAGTTPVKPSAPVGETPGNRAALCENPSLAVSALNGQIASNPAIQLPALYKPRDSADRAALDALSSLVRDTQGLKANARSIRTEATADGCHWLMALDLNWTNAFGQPRRRSIQLRTELELVSGTARVKRIFGATGL